jgi:signal transduction histidine kinase
MQSKYPVATPLLEDLRTATQAMRDLAWGLGPSANTIGDLLDRLREYAARLAPAAPVPLEVRAESQPLSAE